MRLKENFELREVCGESVLIPCGIENIDFNSIIHLNEAGALLWNEAQEGEFTIDSLADVLSEKYDVIQETARQDAALFVEKLRTYKLVEE